MNDPASSGDLPVSPPAPSRLQLQTLLRMTSDGIHILDEDGLLVEANDSFLRMLGLDASAVGRLHVTDWDAADGWDVIKPRNDALMASNSTAVFETRHRRSDGSVLDVEINAAGVAFEGRRYLCAASRDIGPQRKAAQDLLERDELYRTIVSEAADGIVLLDPVSGGFVEFNEAACAQLGYTRDEFAHLNILQLQVDRTPQDMARELEALIVEEGGRFERDHLAKDGSVRATWVSVRPVVHRGRSLLMAVWHDVSSHRQAQAAAERERHMRESVMEAMPGAVYAVDTSGRLTFWNRGLELATGYTAEELRTMTAGDFFSGEDRARILASMRETFEVGHAVLEAEVVSRAGPRVPYLMNGLRVQIGGEPMVVGAGIDISARRRAERELQQLNAQLEQRVAQRGAELARAHDQLAATLFAMEGVGIGIHWVDCESGRFLYTNRYAAELLGYTPEQMLNLHVWDIDPGHEKSAYAQVVQRLREAGHIHFESKQRTRSGALIEVEVSLHFQGGAEGGSERLIAFITDIARRKQHERSLRTAKEDAEAANRAKSSFLANMSHEIRTPMNAIIGLTHLIRRAGVTPEQQDRLGKIDASGRHLLSIINDVLDLAKIEAGRMEIEHADFHLSSVLDNVASIIGEAARAKGLAVEVDTDSVPMWLSGDPVRLRQALLNYAGNAVKFTARGSIRIAAEVLSEDAGDFEVRFQVTDTGVGIEPHKLPLLFREFEQADASTTRLHGGTGLGLAITRRLAALMGGEAGVHSRPGQGSTFWFTARLRRGKGVLPPEPPRDHALSDPWTRLQQMQASILLVEDNPINREVALQLLHGSGLSVDVAVDGKSAVARAHEQLYDLVLMDVQMPGMDGLQATRAIRALPEWGQTPILAMTANAFEDDRRACEAAGMNAFIPKPVEPVLLYETLVKWLPTTVPRRTRAATATGDSPPRADALDDSPTDRVLRRLAQLPGMDVARGVAALLGRRERYVELLQLFSRTQNEAAARIDAALRAGDGATARFLSHTLKGSSAALGLDFISRTAAQLEARLRAGTASDGASLIEPSLQDVAVIRGELARLLQALDPAA